MTIKQQLNKFYDKQGLTGKHRRKAMQYDMKAVRKNIKVSFGYARPRHTLGSAFIFIESPEGHGYWAIRAFGEDDWGVV